MRRLEIALHHIKVKKDVFMKMPYPRSKDVPIILLLILTLIILISIFYVPLSGSFPVIFSNRKERIFVITAKRFEYILGQIDVNLGDKGP